MALAISNLSYGTLGDRHVRRALITFDNSYPTGGEVVTAAQFGLLKIEDVHIVFGSAAGIDIKWDQANLKFKIEDEDNTSGVAAEVANGSDQSTVTARVLVIGY